MSFPDSDDSDPAAEFVLTSRTISGKAVVISIFLLGLCMTGLMFGYWELYMEPFRPLQSAIANLVPESSPRVIGGRSKSHLAGQPQTLRLIVQVPFNPESADSEAERDLLSHRLAELASQYQDLSRYDLLQIYLEHRIPEQAPQQWSRMVPPAEWGVAIPGETP